MLLSSTDLVRYALHCSKSWILAHITHGTTSFVSLARLFSFESSSNSIVTVLNCLSLLLKLFLYLSFLLVCLSTASREYSLSEWKAICKCLFINLHNENCLSSVYWLQHALDIHVKFSQKDLMIVAYDIMFPFVNYASWLSATAIPISKR